MGRRDPRRDQHRAADLPFGMELRLRDRLGIALRADLLRKQALCGKRPAGVLHPRQCLGLDRLASRFATWQRR